jgi:hypothetical protein
MEKQRYVKMVINIELDGNPYWIIKVPSCFTSRKGKDDVSIYKRSTWGRRQPDGELYRCCLRLDAETGTVVRNYESIHQQITVDWLKQVGFIKQ